MSQTTPRRTCAVAMMLEGMVGKLLTGHEAVVLVEWLCAIACGKRTTIKAFNKN